MLIAVSKNEITVKTDELITELIAPIVQDEPEQNALIIAFILVTGFRLKDIAEIKRNEEPLFDEFTIVPKKVVASKYPAIKKILGGLKRSDLSAVRIAIIGHLSSKYTLDEGIRKSPQIDTILARIYLDLKYYCEKAYLEHSILSYSQHLGFPQSMVRDWQVNLLCRPKDIDSFLMKDTLGLKYQAIPEEQSDNPKIREIDYLIQDSSLRPNYRPILTFYKSALLRGENPKITHIHNATGSAMASIKKILKTLEDAVAQGGNDHE